MIALILKKNFKEIYPPELVLKKENASNLKASFRNLDINVKHGKFHNELYDNRDAFPFFIFKISYRDSNMPTTTFCSGFGSEIFRLTRATSS